MDKAQQIVELSLLHVRREASHKDRAHFIGVAVCWCIGCVCRCRSVRCLLRGIAWSQQTLIIL
jgi:hypothetical protein